MSFRSSDKLSCIFYKPTSSPRYYEIRTRMFRFFLYGLPLLTLVSIGGLLVLGIYFKNIRQHTLKKQQNHVIQLEIQKKRLEKEKQELEDINDQLQSKLSSIPTETPSDKMKALPWGIFQVIPGQKDLSSSPRLTVEKTRALIKNGKVNFRFNILNLKKNAIRLNGFVHVVMKTKKQFIVWPVNKLKKNSLMIPFNRGEYFSALRFRPVQATFDLDTLISGEVIFLIVIYNLAGDILHKEIVTETISNEQGNGL